MASRSKELAKNTVILFFGTFCTKAAQFLLLPLYTNILTTTEYGEFELFSTIISLLLPIIGLQVEQGVFRFLVSQRESETEQKRIISTSFFFILLANFSCIFIFSILSPLIAYNYKWILLVSLCLNSIYNYLLQVSRGTGDNKAYSVSNIINTIITITFNVLLLVGLHLQVKGLLYGSIIGYIVSAIYLFIKLRLHSLISPRQINKRSLIQILKYSLPMVPNTLSWWIFSSSDRLIVSWLIGISSTGILSVAYKFSNISAIIYGVFNLSITESVSLHISDHDFQQFFNKVFSSVSRLFISFGSLIMAFMPIIFTILVGKDFDDAYNLIPIATLAAVLQVFVELTGAIYIAHNNTMSIAITSIIAALTNIIVDIALIPFVGIYAAVISTVVAYLILFIYRIINVNKKYIKLAPERQDALYFVLGIIFIGGIYYINSFEMSLISILSACSLAIIFNLNNTKFILSFIKGRRTKP